MSATVTLRASSCWALAGLLIQSAAWAQHVDLAPLTQEMRDGVRRASIIDRRVPGATDLTAHVRQLQLAIEKDQTDRRLRGQLGSAPNAALKSAIASKNFEIQIAKDEALRHLDGQRDELTRFGISGAQMSRLNEQRRAVEDRFSKLDASMKRAVAADDRDFDREAASLVPQLKSLQFNQGEPQVKSTDRPPSIATSRRRPHEDPIPSPELPAHAAPAPRRTAALAWSGATADLASLFAQDSQALLSLQPATAHFDPALKIAAVGPQPSSPSCNATAADLSLTTIESAVTPEIAALAQKLNYSSVRIFEYVSNTIKFEPYWGILKGAQGTLVAGSGGAADQAALLIALMRASNVPARFVRGNISVAASPYNDNPDLRWLGVKSFSAAGDVLLFGNNPSVNVLLDQNQTTAIGVEFSHVWAEVCVPYANYRGSRADNTGFKWIALDASYKSTTAQNGLAQTTNFDYATYMSKRAEVLPQEAYTTQVAATIYAQTYGNSTLLDVPFVTTQVKPEFEFLPAGLPYPVIAFEAWDTGLTAEVATIPDTYRYQLLVDVKNAGNTATLPVQSLWMSDIAIKRLSLGWQGSTAGDQTLLDAWKNQSLATGAPCAALNVKPELRLEGVLLVAGSGTTDICSTLNQLTMTIQIGKGGAGAVPYLVNTVKTTNVGAANVYALHAHAYQTSTRLLTERAARLLADVQATTTPNQPGDEILSEFLNLSLLKWMRYASDAARQIASLDQAYPFVGMHLGVTTSQMKVDYLFDLPFAVHRTGYLIDVGSFLFTPIDLQTHALNWKSFQLSGYASSAYESYIWQEMAGLDAVSTVRGLQFARQSSLEVLVLTSVNWATESLKLTSNTDPTTNYSAATVSTLFTKFISQGATVTIPRSLIQYGDWKGGVYSAEKNTPGETYADFIIDRFAGGYTIGQFLANPDFYSALTDMGFSVNDLLNHPEFWGYPVNAATLYAVNCAINTGSPSPTASAPPPAVDTSIPGIIAATAGKPGVVPPQVNPVPNTCANPSAIPPPAVPVLVGDPVNIVTGNMYQHERDLRIKGRGGFDLIIDRSYNTMMQKDGPLGFGWTHNFNHSLVFLDDNMNGVVDAGDHDGLTSAVAWIDGTGAVRFFQVTGNSSGVPIGSTFAAPASIYFQMARQTNGTYTIKETNGLTYTFESVAGTITQTAKMTGMSDRNGNAVTLAYNGSQLATVTDGLSRSLTFRYNSGGRLAQIQDWSGRQYRYDYDSLGNLVTYWTPLAIKGLQQPTRYTYYADSTLDINGRPSPRNHAMKSVILPRGNGMTFEYYMNGQVFKQYNAMGETTSFTYNPYRRETVMTNPRGITRSYRFDPNGNQVNIALTNKGAQQYTYDCAQPGTSNCANPNNRTSGTDPVGRTTSYVYDPQGNVTARTKADYSSVGASLFTPFGQPANVVDGNGNYILFKYDAKGNLLEKIVMKAGFGAGLNPATYVPVAAQIVQWTINTYDSFGNLLTTKRVKTVSTKAGPTLTYTYDTSKLNVLTVARTGILGTGVSGTESATYTYDTLGRMKTGVDGDWSAIQKNYDDLDRVIQATDKVGNLRQYSYDANGNLESEQINTGTTLVDNVSYSYDQADRKLTQTNSGGYITRFTYDLNGNIIKKVNPDGFALSYEYDDNDQVIRALDPKNNATTTQRDLAGQPKFVTDPNGMRTFYAYGLNGKVSTKTTPGAGPSFNYYYDGNGNVTIAFINAGVNPTQMNGAEATRTAYDEMNRVIRVAGPPVTDPVYGSISAITVYGYDILGNLASVKMGRGDAFNAPLDVLTTQFTYAWDDFGRRIKLTDALNKSWNYKYDTFSNLTQSTDARGQAVFYTWGYGHQLKCVSQTVANATCVTNTNLLKAYTRDSLGQVLTAYSPGVTYTYTYDSARRVTSILDSRASKTLTYQWSDGGRLNRLTSSDGQIVNYKYDELDRLTGVFAPNGDYVSLSWDRGGRLIEKWFPNGINTQFAYNNDGTLAQIRNRRGYSDANIVSQHDYVYDGYFNRTQVTENVNGSSLTYNYTYDDLMRLLTVSNGTLAQQQTYTFDILNNRTSMITGDPLNPVQAKYYSYDAANQLSAIRNTSPTGALASALVYDANGSLITKCDDGTVTGSATACTGATVTASGFDALNRITQITKTGQATQSYVYDDQNRRTRKIVGAAVNDYIYQGQDILAEYANGWTAPTGFITHGAGTDVALIWQPPASDPVGPRYFHQDGINSIVATTNVAGAVDTERFDAYGNKLIGTGSIPIYGFTGREQDGTSITGTGFSYYRARFYDPAVGRFTQRDPIELKGGNNLYSYVGGNPVTRVDPLGLLQQCTAGLNILGGMKTGGVLDHQYSCWPNADGTVTCRGFGRDPNSNALVAMFWTVPGVVLKNDQNVNASSTCTPDNGNVCMNKCVSDLYLGLEAAPPPYSWFDAPGTNCQTINQLIVDTCTQFCARH